MAIPEHTPTDYQRRFQEARKEAGLTCEQLGEVLGMTRQSLSQFENGRQSMDVGKFLLACETMGARLEWVVYGSGARSRRPSGTARITSKKRPAARARGLSVKGEEQETETAPK